MTTSGRTSSDSSGAGSGTSDRTRSRCRRPGHDGAEEAAALVGRHPQPGERRRERVGTEVELLLEGHERQRPVVALDRHGVHGVTEVEPLTGGLRWQALDLDVEVEVAAAVGGALDEEHERGRVVDDVDRPGDALPGHHLDAGGPGLAQQRPDVRARVERERRRRGEVRRAARAVPGDVVQAPHDPLVLGQEPDARAPLGQGVVPREGAVPRAGAGPPGRPQAVAELGHTAPAALVAVDGVDEEARRHEVAARLGPLGDGRRLDRPRPHVTEDVGPVRGHDERRRLERRVTSLSLAATPAAGSTTRPWATSRAVSMRATTCLQSAARPGSCTGRSRGASAPSGAAAPR